MEIKIKRLSHADGLPLPAYQSAAPPDSISLPPSRLTLRCPCLPEAVFLFRRGSSWTSQPASRRRCVRAPVSL